MHNYTTLRAIHDDRMRDLTQKADAHRLAVTAKKGGTERARRQGPGRLVSFGSLRRWLDGRRPERLTDAELTARSGS
jgi:hypothetical protein